MVTGVCSSPKMTANLVGAATLHPAEEMMPIKNDRRSNKPIMEKRRRARINNCLNELKTLILDATKKDPARHSKLEKADILEKTVKHLQELQRQHAAMQQALDPKVVNKFKAGFADCANEVSRFPGLEPAVKRRLLQHLQNCINGVKTELHHHQRQSAANTSITVQQLHGQILPSPPSSPEHEHQHMQQRQQYMLSSQLQRTPHGYFLSNGLRVIPTKLSNGAFALIVPQNQSHSHQQQQSSNNMTLNAGKHPNASVSIPSRTSSTGSASSNSSYEATNTNQTMTMHFAPPSPANSHEALDHKPSVIQLAPALLQYSSSSSSGSSSSNSNQHPLSLVTRKQIKEEEQPWRPW